MIQDIILAYVIVFTMSFMIFPILVKDFDWSCKRAFAVLVFWPLFVVIYFFKFLILGLIEAFKDL